MAIIQGGGGTEPGVRWIVYQNAGAPVDGTTLAGTIPVAGLVVDTTNKNLYINAGTQASPVYKLFTRAA